MIGRVRTVRGALVLLLVAGCTVPPRPAPKPPPPPVRIMPLGDSITLGSDLGGNVGPERCLDGSYRRHLWAMLTKAGKRVDFVGSAADPCETRPQFRGKWDFDHEGHWGFPIEAVLGQIRSWARAAKPDIVLIHLGTNDLSYFGDDAAGAVADMEDLIAALRGVNRKVRILVAKVMPTTVVDVRRYNTLLGQMGSRLGVQVVDMYSGFQMSWLRDIEHPDANGDRFLAQRWFAALRL